MKSVSGKNWEELSTDKRLIEKIKIDNTLNDVQAKLVLSRNFSKEEIFLIRNKIYLKNPFLKTKDFLSGIELLQKSLINNEKNYISETLITHKSLGIKKIYRSKNTI